MQFADRKSQSGDGEAASARGTLGTQNVMRTKQLLLVGLAGIAAFAVQAGETTATSTGNLPNVPKPITSFGATVLGTDLYVFGGHTGEAHSYSIETTLPDLLHLNLDAPGEWKHLEPGVRSQGAGLVAWRGNLYRLGGLVPGNTEDEKETLTSLADFARFDPDTGKWTSLPDLPEPRSSHDAVVAGDTLYSGGGWNMSGPDREHVWHDTVIALNLNQPDKGWRTIQQPFKRRAIAMAAADGKLFFMGGMDDNNDTSRAVDIYDLKQGKWSSGPELPQGPMGGFGAAACSVGDTVYVSTYVGRIFALSPGDTDWREVAEPSGPRFFHRMVPGPDGTLVLIAGASRRDGHKADLEIVRIPELPVSGN